MKIEIDRNSHVAMDEIFNAILVEDWKSVKLECKRMKNRLENDQPNPYTETLKRDLKHEKKIRKAYETLIRYCFNASEAEEIIGKKEKSSV